MEKAQNLVATHAKNNHSVGSQLAPGERKTHPDPRFYTWSAVLVNSIHAEKVKVFVNSISGEVVAGSVGDYATKVELGGPNSRAFPFMGPALAETAAPVIVLFGAAVARVIK